jgi:hypothetical protein
VRFLYLNNGTCRFRKDIFNMAYSTRYGKPNMTNLPSDLGIAIFKEILETPKPDYSKLQEDAARLEKEMIEIRKRENTKGTTSN